MVWVVTAMAWLLYTQVKTGTLCTGGWVGPRAALDGCRKPHPPLGFIPQTIQSVGSCYTDVLSQPTMKCGTIIILKTDKHK